jgi:hypothetical protein
VRYFAVPDRANDLLTFNALMPGLHEEVVVLRGHCFPFGEQDGHRAQTAVIRALAKEGHRLNLLRLILNGVVQALVGLAESHLVLRPTFLASGHRAKRAPAPFPLSLAAPAHQSQVRHLRLRPAESKLDNLFES